MVVTMMIKSHGNGVDCMMVVITKMCIVMVWNGDDYDDVYGNVVDCAMVMAMMRFIVMALIV